MSGSSRSFPQPFEYPENRKRQQNAGNPVYTDPTYIPGGPAPPQPQQTLTAGQYSSQQHAPWAPPSHPSAAPGFPSLPTGYSYPNSSDPPPHTVLHTAPTNVLGHSYVTEPSTYHSDAPAVQRTASMSTPNPSYITQPVSYHGDVPASYASYPPLHPQTTEGVQTTPGDWGYPYPPDSDNNYVREDAEAASSSSDYLSKGPPAGPSKGRPQSQQPHVKQSDLLPCRFCRKFAQRQVVEYWRGFCSEDHWRKWTAQSEAQARGRR